jgi:hypothetical protein
MSTSSISIAAQTGQSCANKAKQVATDKRDEFLTSCLAQISTPANVKENAQQNKRRTCEQNAKNLKLNPGKKPEYFDQCMNKNEAATQAKKIASHSTLTPKSSKRSAESSKNKSCAQQAKEQDLTGHSRKRFMNNCKN